LGYGLFLTTPLSSSTYVGFMIIIKPPILII
jgi:hypothetical protein